MVPRKLDALCESNGSQRAFLREQFRFEAMQREKRKELLLKDLPPEEGDKEEKVD